jgi:hypothetical protein
MPAMPTSYGGLSYDSFAAPSVAADQLLLNSQNSVICRAPIAIRSRKRQTHPPWRGGACEETFGFGGPRLCPIRETSKKRVKKPETQVAQALRS